MRKVLGVVVFAVGLALLGWTGYSLFVETLPQAQARGPLPGVLLSIMFIFVGLKAMRTRR